MTRDTSASRPDLSVVMVCWNTRDALLNSLETVRRAAATVSLEVIVVDNGSRDGSADAVAEAFPEVRLIANRRNAGFARANNQAFPWCRGRSILLLNPDTEVEAEALRGLIEFMDATPDAGAAGLQLLHADGRLQNSYDSFPALETELLSKHLLRLLWPARYPSKRHIPSEPIEVDIIIGACLMLRPEVVRSLHGFDDRYFLFVEEADLCYRIRQAGWKIYHHPRLSIRHTFHFSKEQAPAHATIEYYRSNYFFFKKHKPGAISTLFRTLKSLKLVLVSLPLSVLANVFTLGRSSHHRRRLSVRGLLAAWHLLGCPDSWGMRQVSGFRGYEREERSTDDGRWRLIARADLPEAVRAFLRDAPGSIARGDVEATELKRSRTKTSYRVRCGDAPPLRVTLYRSRNAFAGLLGALRVPRGLWAFERAVEVADQGVTTILPVAAGSLHRRGVSGSLIAFYEEPALVPLQRLLVECRSGAHGGGRRYRGWLRAYGRFVRRLHDAGIVQRDLNPGNALARPTDNPRDGGAIVLVDFERVSIGPPLDWDERIVVLARLNRVLAGFSSADRRRFLDGYLEADAAAATLAPAPPEVATPLARHIATAILDRMPGLRSDEGERAARNCTRENWFFGSLRAPVRGHFRRRAHPWDEAPVLEEHAAAELAVKVLNGEALPDTFEVRSTNGRSGLDIWREANRAFQSGDDAALPLLFVRCGDEDRVVVDRRRSG